MPKSIATPPTYNDDFEKMVQDGDCGQAVEYLTNHFQSVVFVEHKGATHERGSWCSPLLAGMPGDQQEGMMQLVAQMMLIPRESWTQRLAFQYLCEVAAVSAWCCIWNRM